MSTNSNTKRIMWIDIAKAIGMLLVIHNHFSMDYGNNGVKIVIASFHMPLFFILTGLTIKHVNNTSELKNYLLKRIVTIMLPFYLWSSIFIDENYKSVIYLIYGSNPTIAGAHGIGGSWFFPCFFSSCLIVAVISLLTVRRRTIGILVVAAATCFLGSLVLSLFRPEVGFPFSFDVALSGAGFILLGMIFRQSQLFTKIINQKTATKLFLGFVCLVVCIGVAFLNIPSYNNDYHRPVMALAYYGIFPMFMLTGVVGSLAIMLFSMLTDETPVGKVIAKVGAKTFTILMLQQLMIDMVEKVLHKLSISLLPVYPLVFSIIILFAGYLIAIVIGIVYPNLVGKHMLEELLERSEKKQK